MAPRQLSEDTTKQQIAKGAALRLLALGLITKAEAASLAGVSRQLVQHWAREIDTEAAREAVLVKLWQRTVRPR
jgi:predicted DNA-binding protein (UPF0251 family)